MITLLSFLLSVSLLILFGPQWLADILTTHNLAELGTAILGIIALSASLQLRSLFEKLRDILQLYTQYTDPKSEQGSKKLSPLERKRLLDLCLNELRIILNQYGGKVLVRISGYPRNFLKLWLGKYWN